MLEVKNLSFSYDGVNKILENISLSLEDNKTIAILGESGIGKTTLFNLIAGILPYTEGEILINGERSSLGGEVSYMLQKDMLFEHKTVVENIALPLIINKVKKKKAIDEALALLEAFNLQNRAYSYPRDLSGGMQQRVALLRTYMFKRKIILLDEAFNSIDTFTKAKIYEWYAEVSKELELSTILITHNIEEALLLSDKIYVLKSRPAKIALELSIDLPKNRNFDQIFDSKFIEYRKIVYDAITK